MTMFPSFIPPMPQEIVDAALANPEGFAGAMDAGMEAFASAMEGGGDMGAAFEAFGEACGPIMADMGVSPEAFDAAGDMMGAAVGPAMHMAPADAGGADMGAMIQDGVGMMMPEGVDIPAPIMDAMGDLGQGLADAGCGSHEVAAEMMPPPGEPGFPMPVDPSGECIVIAGDPGSCPADACQPPPPDGACAAVGGEMMPPEGGYDHAPMPADCTMPPPMTMEIAMNDPIDSMGDPASPNIDMAPPPGADMAPPPGADMAPPPGADMAPPPGADMAPPPGADMAPPPGADMAPPPGADMAPPSDGGDDVLGAALGGPMEAGPPEVPGEGVDAAIGAAMDAAMEQGSDPAAQGDQAGGAGDDGAAGGPEEAGPDPAADPAAGMG